MPISIRFDAHLQAQLRAMADSEGISVSELVRKAVLQYVEESGDSLQLRLQDVIGTVKSGGGRARKTGAAFRKIARREN